VQKRGRALAPRDQKLGVGNGIFSDATVPSIWQSLY